MSAALHETMVDWERVRKDFPILDQKVHGKRLAFLDNAASSHVPEPVLERLLDYQHREHSNIHRGVHALSQRATDAFEGVRTKVKDFINAREDREIVFVRGATEGINLVMHGYGRKFLKAGDEVVITTMEHHANIVPWQMLRDEKGIVLKVVPITDDGRIEEDAFVEALSERTRLVGLVHVSNSLGTINDVKRLVSLAHQRDIPVLVDGCQATPHMKVDVQDLDADFYVFSGHKMCAPTGSGVLYGKASWLERMQPFMGGGDMILSVSFEKTTYNQIPHKFEAGTPAILPVVGLGAAIDYLATIGMDRIAEREAVLGDYALGRLKALEGVRVFGPDKDRASVYSFGISDVHPHDIGTILDQAGVAIRAGHHCTQPLMKRLGVPATARASVAFYNNEEDVDQLVGAIEHVREIFGV